LFLASMLVVGTMATPTSAQTAKEGSISTTYAKAVPGLFESVGFPAGSE
jgi:hypothetical protein